MKPGEQGVLYSRLFGTELSHAYTEGLTVIWPWNIMYIYDVRAQQVQDKFQVLSKDGLAIAVEISIRFHPIRHSLPFVHVEIGPDYVTKVGSSS